MKQLRQHQQLRLITSFRVTSINMADGYARCTMYGTRSPDVGTELIEKVEFLLPLSLPVFEIGPFPFDTFTHPCNIETGPTAFKRISRDVVVHKETGDSGSLVIEDSFWLDGGFSFVHEKTVRHYRSHRAPKGFSRAVMESLITANVLIEPENCVGTALHYAILAPNELPKIVDDVIVTRLTKVKKRAVLAYMAYTGYCQVYINTELLI